MTIRMETAAWLHMGMPPETAAWLRLQELLGKDHAHGFDGMTEDDGFIRIRTSDGTMVNVSNGGDSLWPEWRAYMFAPDTRCRLVEGPVDPGLDPDAAAERFHRAITHAIDHRSEWDWVDRWTYDTKERL